MKQTKTKTTMIAGVITATAGLLFTGCSSSEYEAETAESSGAQSSYQASTTSSDQKEVVIPLHEERLNIGKKEVDAGHVTIRKVVTTQTVNQPVELRKETVVIERKTGGEGGSSGQASIGAPFEEGSITIKLQEEQPVVEKTTVESGQVIARKNVEWEKQNVQRDVRQEQVTVDKSGNITSQKINEAAGAEQQQPKAKDDQ